MARMCLKSRMSLQRGLCHLCHPSQPPGHCCHHQDQLSHATPRTGRSRSTWSRWQLVLGQSQPCQTRHLGEKWAPAGGRQLGQPALLVLRWVVAVLVQAVADKGHGHGRCRPTLETALTRGFLFSRPKLQRCIAPVTCTNLNGMPTSFTWLVMASYKNSSNAQKLRCYEQHTTPYHVREASTTSEPLRDLVYSKVAFFDQRHGHLLTEVWWHAGVPVLPSCMENRLGSDIMLIEELLLA